MTDWDPQQYERFRVERTQPFDDLLALVAPDEMVRCVDLGCGTGELTVAAADRVQCATMIGIDNSPAMLAAATARARRGVTFAAGDIGEWTSSGDHDLVLANASLQWVADHETVLGRWTAALRSGGQLAVQVPANADHDSHTAIDAVAHREPFRSAFGDDGPPADPVARNVLAPERYAEVLHRLGFVDMCVQLHVYPHVLASSADVVEWTKGTSLNRIFRRLPVALHELFIAAYRDELLLRLGRQQPYFYAFKRILMWARR
jgi:trans-aconitate 2-methyltransferase